MLKFYYNKYLLIIKNIKYFEGWGVEIGYGGWAPYPNTQTPNPQSPIPNPHSIY